MEAPRDIAYGIAGWMVELAMPVGFALLGCRLAGRMGGPLGALGARPVAADAAGFLFAAISMAKACPLWPFALWLAFVILRRAIFAVLGGLALALFTGAKDQPRFGAAQPLPDHGQSSLPRCRSSRWPACSLRGPARACHSRRTVRSRLFG